MESAFLHKHKRADKSDLGAAAAVAKAAGGTGAQGGPYRPWRERAWRAARRREKSKDMHEAFKRPSGEYLSGIGAGIRPQHPPFSLGPIIMQEGGEVQRLWNMEHFDLKRRVQDVKDGEAQLSGGRDTAARLKQSASIYNACLTIRSMQVRDQGRGGKVTSVAKRKSSRSVVYIFVCCVSRVSRV